MKTLAMWQNAWLKKGDAYNNNPMLCAACLRLLGTSDTVWQSLFKEQEERQLLQNMINMAT